MARHKHGGLRLGRQEKIIGVRHLLAVAAVITLLLALGQAAAQALGSPATEGESKPNVMDLMSPSPTIEELISRNEKVVLFWEQKNCPGCKILRPYIYEAADKYPDVLFVKVHIDEILKKDIEYALRIMQEYQVPGTPTLIVFVNGVKTGKQDGLFPTTSPDPEKQYEALLEFLDESLNVDPGQVEGQERSLMGDPLKGLALGLLAAFAPCSVPMIAAFASREAKSRGGVDRYALTFGMITGATLLLGFALTLLYIASFALTTVNPFAIIVVFAGAFIASWGALNLAGREPMIGGGSRSSVLFPILGLQCSLPFLILAMTSITAEPVNVVLTGLAFAAGYSLPYIASAYGARSIASKVARASSSPMLLRIQGLVLLAAGIYLIAETIPLGLVNLG